jgi:hypothetical protein
MAFLEILLSFTNLPVQALVHTIENMYYVQIALHKMIITS